MKYSKTIRLSVRRNRPAPLCFLASDFARVASHVLHYLDLSENNLYMSFRLQCARLFYVLTLMLCVSCASLSARAQGDERSHPKRRGEETEQERKPAAPETAQDTEKIYSDEVRISILAQDSTGHFDPTLEPEDCLILEDGVIQEVKSVRRVPASVLLLLDVGGWDNPAMRAWTTREAARAVLRNLRPGDSIAVMQFAERVTLLQNWTHDEELAERALDTKLFSGKHSHLSDAVRAAADYIKERPVGNRQIVLITDGVEVIDAQKGKFDAAPSVQELVGTQAVVHIISYTSLAREVSKKGKSKVLNADAPPPNTARSSGIETAGIDPTLPPGTNRGSAVGASGGVGIRFDPEMRRRRKAYDQALQSSEQKLAALARATGGRLFLPTTEKEMLAQGREAAQEIGAQYVLTYKPKRPISNLPQPEYRHLRIVARRIGLILRAPEGYSTAVMTGGK
jgi:VWFA-related protein